MRLFTIGYSPHTPETFCAALQGHGVTAVADVRSTPFSAFQPEFNQGVIGEFLKSRGIEYVYLGDMVGARFEDPSVYVGGRADYERIAGHPVFLKGLERIRQGASRFTLALMCAEKDPVGCHRTILIARNLKESLDIQHILADGTLESQAHVENRLLRLHSLDHGLLPGICAAENELDEAYVLQGRKIAYDRRKGEEAVVNE